MFSMMKSLYDSSKCLQKSCQELVAGGTDGTGEVGSKFIRLCCQISFITHMMFMGPWSSSRLWDNRTIRADYVGRTHVCIINVFILLARRFALRTSI